MPGIGRNSGQQEVFVTPLMRLPQGRLQVDAAAGGIGNLAEKMKNFDPLHGMLAGVSAWFAKGYVSGGNTRWMSGGAA